MKRLNLLILMLAIGFIETSSALPIFSHTADSTGLFTITVDGTNEATDLQGLTLANILGTAIGPDGGFNTASGFSIYDYNADDLLQFSFINSGNLTELSGTAMFGNEYSEAFTYNLVATIPPGPGPGPGPNPDPTTPIPTVPEPTTFLLLGAGLIGIGANRFRHSKLS